MAKAIKQFDKSNLQALRVEMDKALQAISNKYGITIKAGNASYSGNECTFKVKCNTKATDGTVITKEAMDWDRHKGFHGMDHLSVGDNITIQGTTYILSGFNTRARKAPVNFKDTLGRGYKCSVRMLANENSK
jgi:hypothetical protein|tara:strand:+ start:733 stop:1131 length:399 start_codon:yes stop_codon:yes gene_type:complete